MNHKNEISMELNASTGKPLDRARMLRVLGTAAAFAAGCLMGLSAAGDEPKQDTTQQDRPLQIQKVGISPSEFFTMQKQILAEKFDSAKAAATTKPTEDSDSKSALPTVAELMAIAEPNRHAAPKVPTTKPSTDDKKVVVTGSADKGLEKTAVADANDDVRPEIPAEIKPEVKPEITPEVSEENKASKPGEPSKSDEKMEEKVEPKIEAKAETKPETDAIKPEVTDNKPEVADKTDVKPVEKPEVENTPETPKLEAKPLPAIASVTPLDATPKPYITNVLPTDAPATAIDEKKTTGSAGYNSTAPESTDDSFVKVTDTKAMKLNVHMNKSIVLETRRPYKRVSVGQPDIADVNLLGQSRILVTGKKTGNTQLLVWDDSERVQVMDVVVAVDVAGLQDQVKKLFPNLKLDISAHNGEVILQGHVPSLEVLDQVKTLASSYGTKVNDLTVISGGQQVMLSVRFAEVSRSASTSLGVNLSGTDGKSLFGSNIGGVAPAGTSNIAGGLTTLLPGSPGAAVTIFGQGLVGKGAIQYFISAMKQNNLLRILAEPNLLAISGQEASFNAGGAIPVPSSQGGVGNAAAVTVDYREYGVKLKFVPIVLGDGRVRLKISPEISDLDWANSVTAGGFRIPGITLRKVSTTIELADGQTFAIAGLLNTSISATKNVTPGLGELPVIGPLFRTVQYSRKETEMVVLVTPHLVEAMNPSDVPPLPGEGWDSPTEFDLYFKGRLGGEISKAGKPGKGAKTARFKGQYGFAPVTSPKPVQSPVANTDKD